MDRRQRKTRTAIYSAFIELLSKKDFSRITVQEILDSADVGRATFYAHFETKDYLLKEMCEELFGHILGGVDNHYSNCVMDSPFLLHLLEHIKNNDDNILCLLSSRNNDLFLSYFRKGLERLISENTDFNALKNMGVPKDYFVNFISVGFTQTVLWWAEREFSQTPEQIFAYFNCLVSEKFNNFSIFDKK